EDLRSTQLPYEQRSIERTGNNPRHKGEWVLSVIKTEVSSASRVLMTTNRARIAAYITKKRAVQSDKNAEHDK
ncbi:MAG: hypothetical protein ABUM51_00325, partial [Bacteroidota bacterium]